MTYLTTLENVELGFETTWGDANAAATVLTGITDCKITPQVESAQILDKRCDTMPAHIATVNKTWGEAEVGGIVNYDEFEYWLDAIFGVDTAPDYVAVLDASEDLQTYRLVYGQDGVTYAMNGSVVDKLTITGETNGPLTYSAHMLGLVPVTATLSGFAYADVIVAMGNHCKVAIDPVAGPVGTTVIANTAFSFEASIENTRGLQWHMGSLAPDGIRPGKWGGSLKLVMEMTSAMKAILDAALAQEISPGAYAIQISAEEPGAGTGELVLSMAGHLLAVPELYTEVDGVTTVELEFTPVYSADVTFESCWMASIATP